MNLRFLGVGITLGLLWSVENSESIILTSTLMTGFLGGFLIGRLTLNNFVGVFSSNGTRALPQLQFPTLPSVNFSAIRFPPLPPLPGLIPREESQNAGAVLSGVSVPGGSSVAGSVLPTVQPVQPLQATVIPYIYAYNYPNMYAYQTVAPTPAPVFRPSIQYSIPSTPLRPLDVPLSLDNRVRDRFIRQLAVMDPLHCLPKIFCEVSADPYGATFITNHANIASVGGMLQPSITPQEIAAYEQYLHQLRQATTTTTPPPTTTSTTTPPAPQNDEENDKSNSESEEDDVSTSGESESDEDPEFELRRKEEEHKMEMQVLEEMVDETDDPQTYMFILRDKQRRKAQRKRFRNKMKQKAAGNSVLLSPEGSSLRLSPHDIESEEEFGYADIMPDYHDDTMASLLNRRMSGDPAPPPPLEPPVFYPPEMPVTTEGPLKDMFDGDPFFDDFRGRSIRSGRQAFQKEELMQKYRIALLVAEKYRNPEVCKSVFPSCPYHAKTILSVVNRLESGLMPFQMGSSLKHESSKENNILQFKNTLLAIERLNKATLQAQARGEPLDLEKVVQTAGNPESNLDASTSENIVNEFKIVAKKVKKNKKKVKGQSQSEMVSDDRWNTPTQQPPQEDTKRASSKEVPSFQQTFKDMFKVKKVKGQKITGYTRQTTTSVSSTARPVQKFSEEDEDDEKDAVKSEEAVNSRIINVQHRSPIV